MRAIGRSGLLVLLLVLQVITLTLTPLIGSPFDFRLVVLALLYLSVIVSVIFTLSERSFSRGVAELAENAYRVQHRQQLLPLPVADERLSSVDKLLYEINLEISEFRRKEHSVINHALDVICSIGHDRIFQSVNPASGKIWGYTPDELIGTKFSDLLVEEDRQNSLQALFGAEKSVDTLSFENRVRRKDGSVLHVLWSAHWSAADKALFCVAHDITARKLAEALLEESEQRIRQMFEDIGGKP